MSSFDFDCYNSEELTVSFRCDKCSAQVHSDPIAIPQPHYGAENSRDSQTDSDDYVICPDCEKEFHVQLVGSFGGGMGEISDLSTETEVLLNEVPASYG